MSDVNDVEWYFILAALISAVGFATVTEPAGPLFETAYSGAFLLLTAICLFGAVKHNG